MKKVPIIPIKTKPTIDSFQLLKSRRSFLLSNEHKINVIWSGARELALKGTHFKSIDSLLYDIQQEVKKNRFDGMVVGRAQQQLYKQLEQIARDDPEDLDSMYEFVEELLEVYE